MTQNIENIETSEFGELKNKQAESTLLMSAPYITENEEAAS